MVRESNTPLGAQFRTLSGEVFVCPEVGVVGQHSAVRKDGVC